MRLILDTNVLLSAQLSPRGAPAKLLAACDCKGRSQKSGVSSQNEEHVPSAFCCLLYAHCPGLLTRPRGWPIHWFLCMSLRCKALYWSRQPVAVESPTLEAAHYEAVYGKAVRGSRRGAARCLPGSSRNYLDNEARSFRLAVPRGLADFLFTCLAQHRMVQGLGRR